MGGQDKADAELPRSEVTRRDTFRLATAVAAFGAAMGLQAPTAQAQASMGSRAPTAQGGGASGKGAQEIVMKAKKSRPDPQPSQSVKKAPKK
jgi:hypothetical protein